MDGVAIWQAVEDQVMRLFTQEIHEVNTENMWKNRHQTYHDRTCKLMQSKTWVMYQPAFFHQNLFVKCDFLVPNEQWTYDLYEVKAKNNIFKKTKEAPLLDDLIADVSIQAYVLKRVLWMSFSWKVFIVHVDKEYKREGEVNPHHLLKKEEVTQECMADAQVEMILKAMRESLSLPQEAFNKRYPYEGSDYMSYFGKKPPKQSLWTIPRLSPAKKVELFEDEKTSLEEIAEIDDEYFLNSKGEKWRTAIFMDLRKKWETSIDREALAIELKGLQYPLYFYDYETISSPVPYFNGTSPWQQVVVQYSLHIVHQDGEIEHHEALIEPWEKGNKRILEKMLQDMNWAKDGTYIVRYKWFENSRNTERWVIFPEYKEQLEYINKNTFDLMEIFSKQIYFDRRFEGSCSIKKVLPVLTDISYDDMEVKNWAIAMDLLAKLATNKISILRLEKVQRDLLAYCKLDSRAMVAIWKKLRELL